MSASYIPEHSSSILAGDVEQVAANWIDKARKGESRVKRAPARPVSELELEAEVSHLRQANAKLKTENEIRHS